MSYVITLPKPRDRLPISRFPFLSAPFHVVLLPMRRIYATLLTHTFLTLTNYNMHLGLSSPLFRAKRALLAKEVFRTAGQASSRTIQSSRGKFTSCLHSLWIHPNSLISPVSWLEISMYVFIHSSGGQTKPLTLALISGIQLGPLKWRRPLHSRFFPRLLPVETPLANWSLIPLRQRVLPRQILLHRSILRCPHCNMLCYHSLVRRRQTQLTLMPWLLSRLLMARRNRLIWPLSRLVSSLIMVPTRITKMYVSFDEYLT